MRWFGNRNGEGHEAENLGVKPRNQILQTPEKETSELKGKLNQSERDKFAERLKCKLSGPSGDNLAKNKLKPKSDAPSKGQRQLERGHVTERE